ncbi:MAG: conjugal transfer protein TraD [Sphingomonas sp.]
MRKPRDFDAELKALGDKARQLKDRKLHHLGELVIATGADVLPIEQLAGLLLAGVENKDSGAKESWRKRGATFFQRTHKSGGGARGDVHREQASDHSAPPAASQDRT